MDSLPVHRQVLNHCIEALYSTFATYSLSANFGDCPQWLRPETVEAIRTKPLRELTAADLNTYVDHVWYCGTESDYMHLLPRILELFATSNLYVTPDMLFLDLASDKWSEAEQAAIRAYVVALWDAFLNDYTFELSADEFLCGVTRMFPDLSVFLDPWDAQESVSSLRQLAAFAHDVSYAYCWKSRPAQLQQVTTWLLRPQIIERLEAAAFAYEAEPFADEFFGAVDVLNNWKSQIQG